VVWRESYRPYGERLVNSASAKDNDVWFTSRRQDSTGLVYMGARYYDAVAGRFVSTDPKAFDEANALSFGRYTYANDNPYKFVDPNGRSAVIVAEGVAVGLAIWWAVLPEQTRRQQAESLVRGIQGLLIWSSSDSKDAEAAAAGGAESEGSRRSNPIAGQPGSCSTCSNSKGDKKQDRFYGDDGWPEKDIDYDHSHKGEDGKAVGKPHAHDWSRPSDGGRPTAEDRGPARPLRPGEGE